MTNPVSIFIASPRFSESSGVSVEYHRARLTVAREPIFAADCEIFNCNLVLARSRAVRHFLETDCTHLLFWDTDVAPPDMRVVGLMLRADRDMIALPYARKSIDWERIADNVHNEEEQATIGRQTGSDLASFAHDVPIHVEGSRVVSGIGEVKCIGLGFMLVRRSCLETMVAHYGPDLTFQDIEVGRKHPTVAIFQLMIRDETLLSEDYSFCTRWRDMGGKVHVLAYPAAHVGTYVYQLQMRALTENA